MDVAQASVEHAEFISEGLSKHFLLANSQFGYNKYKSDYATLLEHVRSRLNDPESEFKYFLLIDDSGKPAGFINTVNTQAIYEILVMNIIPEYDTFDNALTLVQFAVNTLKGLGADKILTETTILEKNFTLALDTLNARLIEQKYILN